MGTWESRGRRASSTCAARAALDASSASCLPAVDCIQEGMRGASEDDLGLQCVAVDEVHDRLEEQQQVATLADPPPTRTQSQLPSSSAAVTNDRDLIAAVETDHARPRVESMVGRGHPGRDGASWCSRCVATSVESCRPRSGRQGQRRGADVQEAVRVNGGGAEGGHVADHGRPQGGVAGHSHAGLPGGASQRQGERARCRHRPGPPRRECRVPESNSPAPRPTTRPPRHHTNRGRHQRTRPHRPRASRARKPRRKQIPADPATRPILLVSSGYDRRFCVMSSR